MLSAGFHCFTGGNRERFGVKSGDKIVWFLVGDEVFVRVKRRSIAAMKDLDIQRIFSFDKGFDSVPGIIRLEKA
jgi:hypothetical protein